VLLAVAAGWFTVALGPVDVHEAGLTTTCRPGDTRGGSAHGLSPSKIELRTSSMYPSGNGRPVSSQAWYSGP
jgi:hypothetical protein